MAIGCASSAQIADQAEAKKPDLIPLCITDLLVKLLFARMDQTVDRYEQKLTQSLQESESAFVAILETEIAETKSQIEQIALPAETVDDYISKALEELASRLPKTMFRFLELA